MKTGKIAVLTSESSWFFPRARELAIRLNALGRETRLFSDHKRIPADFKTVFILSYFSLIENEFLARHDHNLVVHESALPKGRGWAPLFWQVLEGKNKIPVVLFEASAGMDEGPVYLRDRICLAGHELNAEIREKQAQATIRLCLRFVKAGFRLAPVRQRGRPTYYGKRRPKDSRLHIKKSIFEQFNLLRIVDNKDYPAFFDHRGYRYTLSIRKEKICPGLS